MNTPRSRFPVLPTLGEVRAGDGVWWPSTTSCCPAAEVCDPTGHCEKPEFGGIIDDDPDGGASPLCRPCRAEGGCGSFFSHCIDGAEPYCDRLRLGRRAGTRAPRPERAVLDRRRCPRRAAGRRPRPAHRLRRRLTRPPRPRFRPSERLIGSARRPSSRTTTCSARRGVLLLIAPPPPSHQRPPLRRHRCVPSQASCGFRWRVSTRCAMRNTHPHICEQVITCERIALESKPRACPGQSPHRPDLAAARIRSIFTTARWK